MLQRFFATFMTGLLALLPLLITFGIVGFLVGKLSAWFGPDSVFGGAMQALGTALGLGSAVVVYVISLAVVVALIWLLGLVARRAAGRRFGTLVTGLVNRVPFINKIYSSADQVVGLLSRREGEAGAALSTVVMARIANFRVLGMLSSPQPVDIDGVPHYLMFLPSTPIPASGQNLLIPCHDVAEVDLSVEELTKILLSLGSLGPGIMNSKGQLVLPTDSADTEMR